MEIHTVICDVCRAQKKETNNWWKGYILDDRDDDNHTRGAIILGFDVESFSSPFRQVRLPKPDAHLCGIDCAMRWLARILSAATGS
jgi:hypothetical protein